MITVTFPDGARREFSPGISGLEIAKGISPSLAKRTVAMALDGVVSDLSDRLERDVSIEFIARDDPPHMLFSQISLRRSSDADDSPVIAARRGGRYVQQFKFLRLSPVLNYEPIALALMGVQLALSPVRRALHDHPPPRRTRPHLELLQSRGDGSRGLSRSARLCCPAGAG